MTNRFLTLALIVVIAGCTALAVRNADERYGPQAVRDRVASTNSPTDYQHAVEPIFNRRCLVCHACYDAPCQLKMQNFAGLDRGATPAPVYDSARLLEAPLTRLGIDAQTTQQWRDKGFHPVLNERDQTPQNDLAASVLYNMLSLKARNPLPQGILPAGLFDFSAGRAQSCATLEQMPKYEKEHPQWGMPFGLPALTSAEMRSVSEWLSAGAKARLPAPLSEPYQRNVNEWEAFFNGRLAEGAADEPVHVRALVSRRHLLR